MKLSRRYSVAIAAIALGSIGIAHAQAPTDQIPDQRALALVKEVQGQQAQLAANQEKIDTKLATLAETIRLARIYTSRGGR